MRQRTSVFVIGQRTLLREGIASLLQHTDYRVVASAAHPTDLKHAPEPARPPKLVLFGLDNGDYDKTSATIHSLRAIYSGCKIIIIAETSGPIDLQRILAAAPDGFILNAGSREIFLRSLELALLDQQVLVLGRMSASFPSSDLPPCQPASVPALAQHRLEDDLAPPLAPDNPILSEREQQVLTCVVHGYSNKAIARGCNITESTVKVHLKAILRKIDAQNRTQAAIWALDHGYRHVSRECAQGSDAAAHLIPRERPTSRSDPHGISPATILNAIPKQSDV